MQLIASPLGRRSHNCPAIRSGLTFELQGTEMSRNSRDNSPCDECSTLLRELLHARRSDNETRRERFRADWLASGEELSRFYSTYLSSAFAALDQNVNLADSFADQWPRSEEVGRRASEHELVAGHSIYVHGRRGSGIGDTL